MKRWQDRGEVQDSDDDDNSLGNDSQSPSRPRKRARLDQETSHALDRPLALPVEHDVTGEGDAGLKEDWLDSPLVTIYGKKTATTRPEVPSLAPVGRSWTRQDPVALNVQSSPRPSSETDQSTLVLATGPANDELEAPIATQLNGFHNDVHPQTPPGHTFYEDQSALSSPLSELEVSPSPNFLSPRIYVGTHAERAPDASDAHNGDVTLQFHEERDHAPRLRSLRARTEKQLHPFQYDKTLYQQQWRQRGLRPVHYTVPDKRLNETQDDEYSTDESESQQQNGQSMGSHAQSLAASPTRSPPLANCPRSVSMDANLRFNVDYEFPDVDAIIGLSLPEGIQDGIERRKTSHAQPSRTRPKEKRDTARISTLNGLSSVPAPPSPPPTSSDSTEQPPIREGPATFRMPYGTTPVQNPTPQVSSGPHRHHPDQDDESDTDSLSPQRSRQSTKQRRRTAPAIIDDSTESSDEPEVLSRPQPDMDEHRLRRERRRIKGVLPASWLKIDLRAQRRRPLPSPPHGKLPDLSSSLQSPLHHSPLATQKGVARRTTVHASSSRHVYEPITVEDDSENDVSGDSSSALHMEYWRQSRLDTSTNCMSIGRSETFVADETMEADFIDPMLAGVPRPSSGPRAKMRRQPRIADAFAIVPGRAIHRRWHRAETARAVRHTQQIRRPLRENTDRQQLRPTPTSLSILDAEISESEPAPQFIRLAQRRAHTREDLGRHTPRGKHIRLATKDETEEANVVLSAWQGGKVIRRDAIYPVASRRSSERPPTMDPDERRRRQQRLPGILEGDSAAPARRKHMNLVNAKPRLRQARLYPSKSPDVEDARGGAGNSYTPTKPATGINGQNSVSTRIPRQPAVYRSAQLETLAQDFDSGHRASAFERQVQVMIETVSRDRRSRGNNNSVQLDRYFNDGADPSNPGHTDLQQEPTERAVNEPRTLPHRPRKHKAAYVDALLRHYRQPSQNVSDEEGSVGAAPDGDQIQLNGLGPYGSKYATDFEIQSLALGTHFHEATFIGGGDFAASLKLCNRNLNTITGQMRVYVDGEVLLWGPWTEVVAEGIARIPGAVLSALQTLEIPSGDKQGASAQQINADAVSRNADHMLRSVVHYNTNCLAFLDPVDRHLCVEHLQRFLKAMLDALLTAQHALETRCLQYVLVIASQTAMLADHPMIESALLDSSHHLRKIVAHRLAQHVLHHDLSDLRAFVKANRCAINTDNGIRHDDTIISALVILHHCMADIVSVSSEFWTIINEVLGTKDKEVNDVCEIDTLWQSLFSILPILDLDVHGIARPRGRLINTTHDWTLPRHLIGIVLRACRERHRTPGSTINEYVRVCAIRCFHLLSHWGWWRCETILGVLFDSFAHRNLSMLPNEEPRGSPRFLEMLDKQPVLDLEPHDRSFHIFLKMLAVGLQGMRKHAIYTDKRIGGIAWRFIPNHGRTYRKDAEVKQADLEALRNHFDLLCTLYFSSPPGYRLRIDLLQNQVDHTTSHREACRLSVRAWANLASFQAASTEPLEELGSFIRWYNDMIHATILQFRLAKMEAEGDFAAARAQGAAWITEALLDSTVAANQKPIAATLVDLLASMKKALLASRDLSAMAMLLEESAFWKVFGLFDVSQCRLHGAFLEGFAVVDAALCMYQKFCSACQSQTTSEESQEFGDSGALHEYVSTCQHNDSTSAVPNILHEHMGRIISNIFGADMALNDNMVIKAIDVWVQTAKSSVRAGKRTWNTYLDDYSSAAWQQFPASGLKSKITPYFLARVVEKNNDHKKEVSTYILSGWLSSLVERDALLKYQHLLTEQLLNYWPIEPLLRNLPFVQDVRLCRYTVSLADLRLKRLSLISSVLSNIRDDFDHTMRYEPTRIAELRRVYADVIRQVMQSMKSNYQALQSPRSLNMIKDNVEPPGAYVDFVQHVVSFLQQYTADICRIDSFFTDSAAFPLPAADPTYVVGRLRSYVHRLADIKTQKQLAVFVHTVSERAVVDGQQQYLTDQIISAMVGTRECGLGETPTLRHVLLTAILPVYIGSALTTACSWILALPIIKACGPSIGDLVYHVEVEDPQSTAAVLDCIGAILSAMLDVLGQVWMHPGLLGLPHAMKVLTAIFHASQSVLRVCDYLRRCCPSAKPLWRQCQQLYTHTRHIDSCLSGKTGLADIDIWLDDTMSAGPWADTKMFVQKQTKDAFEREWYAHDGHYFVRRGNASVEVVVNLGNETEGRRSLITAMEAFRLSYESVFGMQASSVDAAIAEDGSIFVV